MVFRQKFLFAFLCLAVWVYSMATVSSHSTSTLHIGGMFPISGGEKGEGTVRGQAVLSAVRMALDDINKRTDILPRHRLQLHVNDTKMSYGSTAFSITQKAKRQLFFSTVPSVAAFNDACVAVMRKFNWTRVGLLKQNGIAYSTAFSHLQVELKKSNMQVVTSETFTDDPITHIQALKTKNVRIIVGKFDESNARRVFCQVHKVGMYGRRYAWILLGNYRDNWWKESLEVEGIPCTEEQMTAAVRGSVILRSLYIRLDRDTTIAPGKTTQQFMQQYQTVTHKPVTGTNVGFAYDALWTVALALNKADGQMTLSGRNISLSNFTYSDSEIADVVRKAMLRTQFEGLTGTVKFNPSGDRIGYVRIIQMQGTTEKLVSLYVAQDKALDDARVESKFQWDGGSPPADHTRVVTTLLGISSALYGVIAAVTSACILLAVGFLVFNIKLSHYRYIKMSSPRLNDAILVGCLSIYISVFLFGLDGRTISPEHFGHVCQAGAWLVSVGFTVAFGAMFAKTWRVYVIFTNAKLRKKVIQDGKLFLLVGLLVILDIIILSLWTGLDPLRRRLEDGKIEHGEVSDILPQWELCDCTHYRLWRGTLYTYKGLLLIFGLFLAWETRHVNIPVLNDSHYIGMSVYNVVLLSAIGVPVSIVLQEAQNAAFAFTAVVMLFCTTVTLCLVFVPKLIAVKRDPNILNTSGGTNTSQATGESSAASREKDIGGPKFIALAAENSNLKALIAEKETQIAALEARLKKIGVAPARIRKISQAFRKSDTLELSPSMSALGEAREIFGSIHVEMQNVGSNADQEKEKASKDESENVQERRRRATFHGDSATSSDKGAISTNAPSTPGQRYSLSSKMDSRTSTPTKHSLSLRPRWGKHNDGVAEVTKATYDVIGCHDNSTVPMNMGDVTDNEKEPSCEIRSLSKLQSDAARKITTPKDTYGKRTDLFTVSASDGSSDHNSNLPVASKSGPTRMLVTSKTNSGQPCFQLKMSVLGMSTDDAVKAARVAVPYNEQNIHHV